MEVTDGQLYMSCDQLLLTRSHMRLSHVASRHAVPITADSDRSRVIRTKQILERHSGIRPDSSDVDCLFYRHFKVPKLFPEGHICRKMYNCPDHPPELQHIALQCALKLEV